MWKPIVHRLPPEMHMWKPFVQQRFPDIVVAEPLSYPAIS
jgi:hypothetical protein